MRRRPGDRPRSSRLRPGRHESSPCLGCPSFGRVARYTAPLPPVSSPGGPGCSRVAHETRRHDQEPGGTAAKDRGTRSRRGPAGAYAFPPHAGSCAAGMPLQPVGHRPLQPGGLLLLEAAATLWTSTDHNGLSGKTTTWRNRRVEPAEQAGVRCGGRRPWMEPSATHRAGSDAASSGYACAHAPSRLVRTPATADPGTRRLPWPSPEPVADPVLSNWAPAMPGSEIWLGSSRITAATEPQESLSHRRIIAGFAPC